MEGDMKPLEIIIDHEAVVALIEQAALRQGIYAARVELLHAGLNPSDRRVTIMANVYPPENKKRGIP